MTRFLPLHSCPTAALHLDRQQVGWCDEVLSVLPDGTRVRCNVRFVGGLRRKKCDGHSVVIRRSGKACIGS
jgi:hypothetical protein